VDSVRNKSFYFKNIDKYSGHHPCLPRHDGGVFFIKKSQQQNPLMSFSHHPMRSGRKQPKKDRAMDVVARGYHFLPVGNLICNAGKRRESYWVYEIRKFFHKNIRTMLSDNRQFSLANTH
jgi:hypothetical protein